MMNFLSDFYEMFSKEFTNLEFPAEDKYVAPLTLLMSCQYQLITSTLTAMRGHIADSLQYNRRAIESCAFAYKIFKHPHLAMIWLEAGKSEQSYKKYKDKFIKLFPEENNLLKQLGERYDVSSKMMHSTIYSISTRLKVTSVNDEISGIDFNYFDSANDNRGTILTIFYIWDTHRLMINVFLDIFNDLVNINKQVWDLRIDSLDSQFNYYKNLWRDELNSK